MTSLLLSTGELVAAGEERFRGGAHDGYDAMRLAAISDTVRGGWYKGGGGDGASADAFVQTPVAVRRTWYAGGAGDGQDLGAAFASVPVLLAAWFHGGPNDGSDLSMIAGLSNPLDRDSDGDGLPDWWELEAGQSLVLVNAMDDPDDDGFYNGQEYGAGTVPTNGQSLLRFEATAGDGAGLLVTWQSVDGKRYRLERATNLMGDFSFLVKTNILGVAPMNTETDTTAAGVGPWLYRIKLE